MRDKIRHIGQWLSALLMVVLLVGCGKSSDSEGGEEPGKKSVLKVYVFAPAHPVVTRAADDVDASEAENKIHSLHVWVFENHANESDPYHAEDGKFVGHIVLNNVDLSEAGSEVSIDISDEFVARKPNVDVYVAANVTESNCGLKFDGNTDRATLEGASLKCTYENDNTTVKTDYFGVSSLVSSVPSDGLPMSGVLKNQTVYGESPVFRVGDAENGLANVKLVRAVSKVRFVFSKSSTNTDNLMVNSITLDGGNGTNDLYGLPNEEKLFLNGVYPNDLEEVNTSANYYARETPLVSDINGNTIATNDSPASYGYDGTMTAQEYENLINKGITSTPSELTELGRFYFRESDQKVSGEISYSIGGTPKKATFATPTANGFTRNHTWIVYGYFVSSGNLLLNMVEIKDWINIETPDEVYNW